MEEAIADTRIAEQLEGSSDEDLLRLLPKSELLEQGYAAVVLPHIDARVFVKALPVTTLELLPQYKLSTANIFELPTYYQYRLGGCGFGAWQEPSPCVGDRVGRADEPLPSIERHVQPKGGGVSRFS